MTDNNPQIRVSRDNDDTDFDIRLTCLGCNAKSWTRNASDFKDEAQNLFYRQHKPCKEAFEKKQRAKVEAFNKSLGV